MSELFDLIIIGGGPGGYEAAIEASRHHMKTALIERDLLGGTCLNRGCIPTKTILHTADLYRQVHDCDFLGLEIPAPILHMDQLHRRTLEVTRQLRDGVSALMKSNHISVFHGSGALVSSRQVRVSSPDQDPLLLEGDHILIATGSESFRLPIPGADLPGVLTSTQLLEAEDLYSHLIIIGGGVIGMEFASIYTSFGRPVTIIETMDRILPSMDKEISQSLKMLLKKRGADIHTSAFVTEILPGEGKTLICRYQEKGRPMQAVADAVLIAAGRRPCTQGLFAPDCSEEVRSMKMERGCIVTDDTFATSVPGIWAVGDVCGGICLAHMASAQGRCAAAAMADAPMPLNLKAVPSCVYTDPEIASAGLTLSQAKEQGIPAISHKYSMGANGKSLLSAQERGFIKVVAHAETHKILGAQMMCARATDMISQFSAAIVNDLTLKDLGKVIYPHPTFSEAIGETVSLH